MYILKTKRKRKLKISKVYTHTSLYNLLLWPNFYQKKKNLKKIDVKYSKSKKAFKITYIFLMTLAFILGFLSISYYSYKIFNNNIVSIILFVILILLLIISLVDNLMTYKNKLEKLQSYLTFPSLFLLILLKFIINYNIWRFISFLILNFVIISVMILHFKRKSKNKSKVLDKKVLFALLFSYLLIILDMLSHNYLNYLIIAWALIPALVLFVIFVILLFTTYKEIFYKISPKIITRVGFTIIAFFGAFFISWCGLDIINASFSPPPTIDSYVILDKNYKNGYRQVSQFLLTVNIDGKEVDIEVPSNVYHEKSIGDTLDVGLYDGLLGFAYYEYNG